MLRGDFSPLNFFYMFNKFKEIWDSVSHSIYQSNYTNRIGDEIQCTALYKYIKSKNINIDYKDSNTHISALSLFPDNLVRFLPDNINSNPNVNFINLWIWSPFLAKNGFYTESQYKYNESEIQYDCVFIPCLSPEYNTPRAINNPQELFYALKSKFKDTICVIDSEKKNLFPLNDKNVVYSDDIHTTFKYIQKSKYYVGCDTGTSHYAGSINHPRMTLLYPDETEVRERISWQKDIVKFIFNVPEIMDYEPSTIPCCNPDNYQIVTINNKVCPQKLLSTMHK